MRQRSQTHAIWRLATAALLAGATMLALASGDPLLLLGVLCAAAGVILLARPAPVAHPTAIPARPAAVPAAPRRHRGRHALAGAHSPAMLRQHGSQATIHHKRQADQPSMSLHTAPRRTTLLASER